MTTQEILATSRWARVHLGIPPEEFFSYTLVEWGEVFDHFLRRERAIDVRFARLTAHLVSASGAQKPNKAPFKLDDFLPPDPLKAKAGKKAPRKRPPAVTKDMFMAATPNHTHVKL